MERSRVGFATDGTGWLSLIGQSGQFDVAKIRLGCYQPLGLTLRNRKVKNGWLDLSWRRSP